MQNESIQRERYPTAGPRHLLCRPSSGFSLLEVLMASGILVFGILAIARIFPAGLGVIRSNNDVNTATRLAEDLQTRYSRLKDELPDAVISVDASGGFVTDIDPTTSPDDSAPNSVSGVTRVVGEAHRVLNTGKVIVNFPKMLAISSTNPDVLSPRVYRKLPLREVPSTSTPAPAEFKRDSVDLGKLIFNGARLSQYVRISYKWIDDNNNGITYYVENERQQVKSVGGFPVVTVAAASIISFNSSINFKTILPGSLKVLCEEDSISPSPSGFSSDLLGGGVITGLPSGTDVTVDYTIDDWRWVTQEIVVPDPTQKHPSNNASMNISVANTLLKPLNDLQSGKVYVTVVKDGNVVEFGNGATLNPSTVEKKDVIEPLKGLVRLDNSLFSPGQNVRLTYQTGDEWTVQIAKAPSTFTDVATDETYRQFADRFWQGGSDTQTLGFKQINAGGTVVVDYATTTGTSVYGELHAIGRDAATTPVYTTHPYEIKLFSPYREIISVRGVSSTARVFWIDKGHYRRVEISTYLVKK